MKNSKKLFLSMILAIFTFATINSYSQYCEPYFYYAGNYMGINYVQVADMENWSDWPYSPGYNYYEGYTANMSPGDKINFFVEFGYTYDMGLSIWIDLDQNGDFDGKDELVWTSGSTPSYSGFEDAFTLPMSAKPGRTRMRIMSEYYYMYSGYPPSPCSDYTYYYGEAEDYDVFISPPPPDAAMVSVDNPKTPFSLGYNDILATFTNKNDNPLNSCSFYWYVNNKYQGTYNWAGTIKKDQQIQLNLGSYNFQYPPNGPFDPFNIQVYIGNQNGDGVDQNYGNDQISVLVAPVLNDAGVVGFYGPAEGFGPGVTPVRARVMNYAPKPLSSVRVRWSIDGVEQPSFTATGLNIPYLGTQDIVVGNYTFYNKTPMGPFSVKAWTEAPNAVTDEVKGNDEYNGGIGPSFVPGTHTIGAYGAHFATLTDASSYLSASGVLGTGDVIFEIRPGTYNGQVLINASLVNNNTIIFQSSTGRASDVTIAATPTNLKNYVFLVDGMKNVIFKNLTFKNNATSTSLAGNGLVVNNGNNIKVDYCNFYGVASSPRNEAYTNLLFNNTDKVFVTNSIILNGANGITNAGTVKITNSLFDNNIISDYSWKGIYNNFSMPDNNVVITNNVIRNASNPKPPYGIASTNGTIINNNLIDGLTGTGTDSKESGIYLMATSTPKEHTEISGNKIVNIVNANGIFAENTKIKALNNLINCNPTIGSTMALLNINNSIGYAGNNVMNGGNISGFRATNSPNFYFMYNTVVVNSASYPAIYTSVNGGTFYRNIFQNNGTYACTDFWGTLNCNDNNYYSSGANQMRYNGANHTLISFQNATTMDKNSSNKQVVFEDVALNNLKLKTYIAELLKGTPLVGFPEPMLSEIQGKDFEGNPRASYYAGSDEIKLEITIEEQTDGIIDCIGAANRSVAVSAFMSYGVIPTYQWEKDGVVIPGQTKDILTFANLKLSDNGVYRCLIKGPGDTKPLYSQGVTVYVLTGTEITEEPKSQYVEMGGKVFLQFAAHVNGRKVEDALRMNEISIQWYKVNSGGDIAIVDDAKYAGAKSNILSITKFNAADIAQYYAKIEGLCGIATTAKAELKELVLDLTLTAQPANANACEGDAVSFKVEAATQSANEIKYEWFKDGVSIVNNATFSGANTNTLNVSNLDKSTVGSYYCMVTLDGTALFEKSNTANLTVGFKPVVVTQPQDVQVQIGKDFSLTIELEDENGVTFEWFNDSKSLSTEKTYNKTNAQPEDAGKYWCVVTNTCGEEMSAIVNVVVTTGTSDVSDKEINGYKLSSIYPTPSTDVAQFTYTMANAGKVRIAIADVSGKEVIELVNNTVDMGTYSINANIANLSNGVYYLVMNTGTVKLTQKISVVK